MGNTASSTLLVQAPAEERQATKEQASWAADFDLDIRTIVIPHHRVENVNLTPSCSCGSCSCAEACESFASCYYTC